MGFKLNINTILRSDDDYDLETGNTYKYTKDGMSLFTDNIPIWLTKKDWTPLAEIQVIGQERKNNKTTIEFELLHVYDQDESEALKNIFTRMYGWD